MPDIAKLSLGKQIELARNHNTSSEVLQQLDLRKRQIQQLLASNPNTPIAILEKVSHSYYEKVIDNPVFELLLLENRDRKFIKLCLAKSKKTSAATLEKLSCDCDPEIQREVARNPNISAKIIEKYAQNEEICRRCMRDLLQHTDKISDAAWSSFASHKSSIVLINIALHAQAPINILSEIAGDPNSKIRAYLAGNPNLPLEILVRLSEDFDSQVRLKTVRNRLTPKELLAKLAGDSDLNVRRAVAKNSRISTKVLTKLAEDPDSQIRLAVAKNSRTSAEVLTKLTKDLDFDIRNAIASNSQTPVDILTKLAKDVDSDIRNAIASNPNTPVDILIKLADDRDFGVRGAVARNSQTPVEVLIQLSQDIDFSVRCLIAKNLRTPVEILHKLFLNSDPKVRSAAISNPNLPIKTLSGEIIGKFFRKLERRGRYYKKSASSESFEEIVQNYDKSALIRIAGNINLPQDISDKLAAHPSQRVRKAVAENPAISSQTLAKLVLDTTKSVRRAVTRNQNILLAGLIALSERDCQFSLRKLVLKQLIVGDKLDKVLEILAASSDWLDRKTAAGNTNTSPIILEKLSRDRNRYVREKAIDNLKRIYDNQN